MARRAGRRWRTSTEERETGNHQSRRSPGTPGFNWVQCKQDGQRSTYQSGVCLLKAVLEPVDDAEVGVVLLLQLVHLAVQLSDLAFQVGDHLERKCY